MSNNGIDLDKLSQEDLNALYNELQNFNGYDPSNWSPHSKQKEFHMSNAKGRILLGGNRSGKSAGGCADFLMHVTGRYPDWYPKENRFRGPIIGRIVVTDFSKGYNETLKPKIDQWLPKNQIKRIKRNHEGYPEKYYLMNGSSFDICTHCQEKDVFEGWSGHIVWFDEPPPRYAYIGSLRGLIDFNGRFMMTLTPLTEPWLYDEVISLNDPKVKVIYMDITDNPFIKSDEIDFFKRSLTSEEREARLHGKFLHLSGLVYKNLNEEAHFKKLDLDNTNSPYSKMKKQWYFILDPHDRRPHCGLWIFINPNEKSFIAYELFMEATISELCDYILAFERIKKIPFNEIYRIGDPNKMLTPSALSKDRATLKMIFEGYGLDFDVKVDDDITRGHMVVREALNYDKDKPIDEFNSPSLFFSENVPETKKMFMKYVFGDWRNQGREVKNPREIPKDLHKDFPDCVRYYKMSNPYYYEKESVPIPKRNFGRTGYH